MKYIIGSGLVGLLAKMILGDEWQLIPQKRSRYYTFDPILADNFIVREEGDVDETIKSFSPLAGMGSIIYYKRAFSLAGQLLYKENDMTVGPYLAKIYGDKTPTLAPKLIQTGFWVYSLTAKALHDGLLKLHIEEIKKNPYEALSIDLRERKMIIRNISGTDPQKIEFDKIVSTVPLDVLYRWCGINDQLESRSICYYHIRTKKVDLEKADQALVCDDSIDFFKVTRTKNVNEYLFWTFDQIENPHSYFGMFLNYDLDILDAFRIEGALPLGDPPDLKGLESAGIHCVGSNAQWDDFMDVSSCIKRLTRL